MLSLVGRIPGHATTRSLIALGILLLAVVLGELPYGLAGWAGFVLLICLVPLSLAISIANLKSDCRITNLLAGPFIFLFSLAYLIFTLWASYKIAYLKAELTRMGVL